MRSRLTKFWKKTTVAIETVALANRETVAIREKKSHARRMKRIPHLRW
jgi:hypothetical protein